MSLNPTTEPWQQWCGGVVVCGWQWVLVGWWGGAYQYHLPLCDVLGSLPGQEAESVLPQAAAATQLCK